MPRKKKEVGRKKKLPADIEPKESCWSDDPLTHRRLFTPPKKNASDKKTTDS